jgi:hypothetical protein
MFGQRRRQVNIKFYELYHFIRNAVLLGCLRRQSMTRGQDISGSLRRETALAFPQAIAVPTVQGYTQFQPVQPRKAVPKLHPLQGSIGTIVYSNWISE